jgi:hypothetical protein
MVPRRLFLRASRARTSPAFANSLARYANMLRSPTVVSGRNPRPPEVGKCAAAPVPVGAWTHRGFAGFKIPALPASTSRIVLHESSVRDGSGGKEVVGSAPGAGVGSAPGAGVGTAPVELGAAAGGPTVPGVVDPSRPLKGPNPMAMSISSFLCSGVMGCV